MNFKVGFQTDIGQKRQQNQDSGVAIAELGLFMVADGMGGHRGGEIASQMAVQLVQEWVQEHPTSTPEQARDTLARALESANDQIYHHSLDQQNLSGMGTTATVGLFSENHLTLGHVGDSRCYFIRPEGLWQITRDHSLVQEKLRAGLITREQAKTDRMRNVITRSVGFENQVHVENYELDVSPGDVILFCSDGLSGLVEDSQIFETIQDEVFKSTPDTLESAAKKLVQLANDNGGDDNITVVLVQIL